MFFLTYSNKGRTRIKSYHTLNFQNKFNSIDMFLFSPGIQTKKCLFIIKGNEINKKASSSNAKKRMKQNF